jgi:hypothetical protein
MSDPDGHRGHHEPEDHQAPSFRQGLEPNDFPMWKRRDAFGPGVYAVGLRDGLRGLGLHRLFFPLPRRPRLDRVKETARGLFQDSHAGGIEVIGFEPALVFVVPVVVTGLIELQTHAGSGHPEDHDLEQPGRGVSRSQHSLVEPAALFRQSPVSLLFFLPGHGLESREAAAFHGVEAEALADEIEVAYDLIAAVDALADDAGEGFSEETGAMEEETEPVEEGLHHGGDMERIVGAREHDTVRLHHLFDEHIPVVLQGTEFLPLLEARLAASADPDPMIAQCDDFAFDIAQRSQIIEESADGVVGVLFAGAAHECRDFLHDEPTFMISLRMHPLIRYFRFSIQEILIFQRHIISRHMAVADGIFELDALSGPGYHRDLGIHPIRKGGRI